MLQIESVSKQYSTKVLLTEASAHLRPNSRVGLVGPNGAGKTTTIQMLTTLARPTSGTALIAGHDICTDPLSVRRGIGYVPENVRLDLLGH